VKSSIDYLKFRTKESPFSVLDALRPALWADDCVSLGPEMKGKDGWQSRRAILMADDLHVAWMDYGGESQRGWLRFDMSGTGCEWIKDWHHVATFGSILSEAELRRVDIKVDTFDGSVSHDVVLQAYEAGRFTGRGRTPKMKKVEGSDIVDGRTVYIGSRASSKYIRCYEKGREILNKLGAPEWVKKAATSIEGSNGQMVPVEDYYRVEVEFKADDGVVLPWPLLFNPDPYFAGANEFCASLVDAAPSVLPRMPSDFVPKASLAVSMEHCRQAYGGLLRSLLQVYGDSMEAKANLFDELSSNKASERLMKAGIYTVSH